MDDEDRRALEALRSSAPVVALAAAARRSMVACPHCREGFGSASLAIHVRRCRALLPPPESELEAATPPPAPSTARRPPPSLVDLCLRFVNKHFESLYLDRVTTFPEAEGALIASMPPNLVHRLIINLVNSSKKLKANDQMHRATTQKLQSALDEASREREQLAAARRAEALARTRLGAAEQTVEELRRELELASRERSSVQAQNRELLAQVDALAKQQTRLEAKIQSLQTDKDALRESAKAAQKREMEATKRLALASRERPGRQLSSRRAAHGAKSAGSASHQGRTSASVCSGSPVTAVRTDRVMVRQQLELRKRPRSAASSIPLPRFLSDEYRRRLELASEPLA